MKLIIEPDNDAGNPRTEWDNTATMVCFHRHSKLGDEHKYTDMEDALVSIARDLNSNYREWVGYTRYPDDDQVEAAKRILEKRTFSMPLFLYEHSGMTMRTDKFSCPWDSGMVGFIYMTIEQARKEFGTDLTPEELETKATECMKGEVTMFDQYLTGDVWIASIVDGTDDIGEEIDSCLGLFGRENAEQEGANMLKTCQERVAARKAEAKAAATKEATERQYWAERDVVTA